MPVVETTLSDEEKRVAKIYAQIDGRSLSNLMRKALIEKIRRDRKKGPDGQIIRPPGESA